MENVNERCRTEIDDINDRMLAKQLAADSAAESEIREHIEALVAVAARSSLWIRGDGYGGWIYSVIQQSAREVGLEVSPPTSGPYASRNRKTIPSNVRAIIYARDGLRCVDCGTDQSLTVDHVIAVVNGGTDDIENLATRCRSCNSRKGAK